MDRTSIEKTLAWINPQVVRRAQGRRIKVYVESLDLNFYLQNRSGRRLPAAMLVSLAYDGIAVGWKQGVEVWPRDISLLEIGLMKLAMGQRAAPD